MPRGELGAGPHDEQHGLAILGAEALVRDRDAVRLHLAFGDWNSGRAKRWRLSYQPGGKWRRGAGVRQARVVEKGARTDQDTNQNSFVHRAICEGKQ